MSNIDLGNAPVGTPPDSAQQAQIRLAIDSDNRANHTGTQAHTTISGLGTAATADTGTTEGTISVLAAGGIMDPARLPAPPSGFVKYDASQTPLDAGQITQFMENFGAKIALLDSQDDLDMGSRDITNVGQCYLDYIYSRWSSDNYIDTGGYLLAGGDVSIDWGSRWLLGNGAELSVDWDYRQLYDASGNSVIDWSLTWSPGVECYTDFIVNSDVYAYSSYVSNSFFVHNGLEYIPGYTGNIDPSLIASIEIIGGIITNVTEI